MKLKGFDIHQILFENDIYTSELKHEIINKIKPFIIFFDDTMEMGICFIEQKENIINVLKEYGELSIKGHFINLDLFIADEDVCYDYVYIGDFEIDGDEVMKEFSRIIKKGEEKLLNNFENEWYKMQKEALEICLNKEIKILTDKIENAKDDLEKMKGIYN